MKIATSAPVERLSIIAEELLDLTGCRLSLSNFDDDKVQYRRCFKGTFKVP